MLDPFAEPRDEDVYGVHIHDGHPLAPFQFRHEASIAFDHARLDVYKLDAATSSRAGAERAAIAYLILATCALAGTDPVASFANVLPRLRIVVAVDAHALAPAAWKAARSATE